MLFVLVLLAFVAGSGGDEWYSGQCSEKTESSVSVDAAADNIEGRYVVRYCTASSPLPTKWKLHMYTIDVPPENCSDKLERKKIEKKRHSFSEVEINSSAINSSCPFICLSQAMDLMYHSCYWLTNQVDVKGIKQDFSSEQFDTYHYINSTIPRYTVNKTSHFAECNEYETEVICTWLSGPIPYTKYDVEMWPKADDKEPMYGPSGEELVTDNCTRLYDTRGAVRCRLLPAPGQYVLQFTHHAPWTQGFPELAHSRAYFTFSSPNSPRIERAAWSDAVWWGAGVSLLAVSLLAGLIIYHKREGAKIQMRVWQRWLTGRKDPDFKDDDVENGPEGGAILLLYARDCPPVQRLADTLRQLLESQDCGKVLDIYKPEVLALAGAAPAAFVSSCMCAARVRVLLLQTPALAALHTARLADTDSFKLEEPLLPRRVMYSSPVFGDALLQYALRLMCESQPERPYRKYMLATLSSLAVDAFPSIVPYTRYELPEDALALLHALQPARSPALAPSCSPALAPSCSAAQCAHALSELSGAARDVVQYVSDNPNYLAKQIVFL